MHNQNVVNKVHNTHNVHIEQSLLCIFDQYCTEIMSCLGLLDCRCDHGGTVWTVFKLVAAKAASK
jgi:hypothetical protein